MKKRILWALFLLPLLLAGCEKEKPGTPPTPPDIPEGTIPVVFHILYENSSNPVQNPSSAILKQRVEQMNKFYASTLFTDPTIPGVPSQNIGLTFTLATHDPNGNAMPEPGTHRVQYAGSQTMSAETFLKSNNSTPKNAPLFWDPNRYVNIWIFGFDPATETGVTGIAILAYSPTNAPLFGLSSGGEYYFTHRPSNMHGIALNNRYFLPPGDLDLSDPNSLLQDEGMFTLCHEMGHYLGLLHAFDESDTGGCTDPDNASDDGCSDTPKYDRTRYMSTIQPFLDGKIPADELPYNPYFRQPCDGSELRLSTNVMDYYFSLRTNLTAQQKARIEHVMKHSPLIPRGTVKSKAMLENFTGEITDQRPEPILMY